MSCFRIAKKRNEEQYFLAKDPIDKVLKVIKDKKYASQKQLDAIESKIQKLIAEAIKFAEESPLPTAADSYKDVYEQEDYPFIKE